MTKTSNQGKTLIWFKKSGRYSVKEFYDLFRWAACKENPAFRLFIYILTLLLTIKVNSK